MLGRMPTAHSVPSTGTCGRSGSAGVADRIDAAGERPRRAADGVAHGAASVTTVDGLRDLVRARESAPAPRLPVHRQLAEAFPDGLRAGGVYALEGSRTIALAMLAGPSEYKEDGDLHRGYRRRDSA